jgi:hypothetical protein
MIHEILKNLSPTDITLLVSLVGFFSVIVPAIVGGLSSLTTLWLSKRYEEKKHFRTLAIQAALDNWRMMSQLRVEAAKAFKTHEHIDSPDGYIIHMLRIMEIAANTKITSEEAAKIISKMNSGSSAPESGAAKHSEENS